MTSRKGYQIFGIIIEDLEIKLKKEVGLYYHTSGEKKELNDAVNTIEELYKFLITSEERENQAN